MKKIAFYVSGRRESVLRCSAIINTLLRLEKELECYVKIPISHKQEMKGLLLEDRRVSLFESETDLPLEVTGKQDEPNEEISSFVDRWEELAEEEKTFLMFEKIGLIVSDLCPWIGISADEMRIPNVLITDFVWEQGFGENLKEDMAEAYREGYELFSQLILYDIHHPNMEELVERFKPVSLAAHPYDMELIGKIRMAAARPVVFAELPKEVIELQNFEDLPYYFILPELEEGFIEEDNVLCPKDFRKNMHNYIAASDYVAAGPRWDVMAYALLANKKAVYYSLEEDLIGRERIRIIEERGQCIKVEREELRELPVILKKLDDFAYNYDGGYHNDDYEIAKLILGMYPKKRRKKGES